MRALFVILLAYFLGSIPFGYLIVRATKGADIRQTGSGGTGATNVSRRAGKLAGVLTLVLDALKGAAAVIIAESFFDLPIGAARGGTAASLQSAPWLVAAVAIAVILGHMFPVWLGFQGGKGVATGVGVFLVWAPVAIVLALLIFVLIVWRTRYVSLGSMLAAVTIPLFALIQNFLWPSFALVPLLSAASVSAALIIFAHRANIGRLMQGTEHKFV
ncbi:MAG TPA: glycerol-3-phosphate 1-O-acyltransferase PlsY [Pyrinomonadaceae bacterium]|nr:glycerol-3-phosphate 1-O-acyltransferase PlsY [Pyrinomonadaceae bacterium]